MQEVAAWRSELCYAAIIHKERVIFHPLPDGCEAGLLQLFDLLFRTVLHDPEVGPPCPVPLACLRAGPVLSWLHLAHLTEGKDAMDLSGTAFQPADFRCNTIVTPCFHRHIARWAFGRPIEHVVVAFVTLSEGNRCFLGGDTILKLQIVDLHLCYDTGLPSRVATLSFSPILTLALSTSFDDLRVGDRRIESKQVVRHLLRLDAFGGFHVTNDSLEGFGLIQGIEFSGLHSCQKVGPLCPCLCRAWIGRVQ